MTEPDRTVSDCGCITEFHEGFELQSSCVASQPPHQRYWYWDCDACYEGAKKWLSYEEAEAQAAAHLTHCKES